MAVVAVVAVVTSRTTGCRDRSGLQTTSGSASRNVGVKDFGSSGEVFTAVNDIFLTTVSISNDLANGGMAGQSGTGVA